MKSVLFNIIITLPIILVYAAYMDTVIQTSNDLVSKKAFSLPKMMLIPQVIMKHPLLLAQIFPLILVVDNVKNRLLTKFTKEVELTSKEKDAILSKRSQIEQFDMKNSENLQTTGKYSLGFTKNRWNELTESIQKLDAKAQILNLIKKYIRALYWLVSYFE